MYVFAGVSQLSFAIFDLTICVELPQSKTKRLPAALFVSFEGRGEGGYDRFKKTLVDILAKKNKQNKNKNRHKREPQVPPCRRRERCESRVKKSDEKR